ncbi:MAG: FAD-binding domain-containing protein [Actinomycetota bacterium]
MSSMSVDHRVPTPDPGRGAAEAFVAGHLFQWCLEHDRPGGEIQSSDRFRGGQTEADRRLAAFDVVGYARRRNEAYPEPARGASRLSPYIRHGLLSLPRTWDAVADGPTSDAAKFRDELLWQEYARHWYARLGSATARPLRRSYPAASDPPGDPSEIWDQDMACLELTIDELEDDGWLVNQTRMWLASHWTVRHGLGWRAGEDYFFRHLLDGSRAANRLGWQWTSGVGSNRPYGFSRWQVEKRAPGLCASCELGAACPIDEWPDDPESIRVDTDPRIRRDDDPAATAGPREPERVPGAPAPGAVWLTAESLGDADPALVANPNLPAVFVFDGPLLARLRLSSKRLVFLTETLAELATRRPVELHIGDPVEVLAGRAVATTFAPVPGWRRRAAAIGPVEVHPWRWLRRPIGTSVGSFSAWAKRADGRG